MRTVSGLRPGGGDAEPARQIAPTQDPLVLARVVVVEDVRRSAPPAGALSRSALPGGEIPNLHASLTSGLTTDF